MNVFFWFRQFEERELRSQQERAKKRLEFENQKFRLQNQIEFERSRDTIGIFIKVLERYYRTRKNSRCCKTWSRSPGKRVIELVQRAACDFKFVQESIFICSSCLIGPYYYLYARVAIYVQVISFTLWDLGLSNLASWYIFYFFFGSCLANKNISLWFLSGIWPCSLDWIIPTKCCITCASQLSWNFD
jgi:hypothetical protein